MEISLASGKLNASVDIRSMEDTAHLGSKNEQGTTKLMSEEYSVVIPPFKI